MRKKILLALQLSAIAAMFFMVAPAQQNAVPAAEQHCAPNDQAFDKAYWLSLPPQLRIFDVNGGDPIVNATRAVRENSAAALAGKGFNVDIPILVFQWDACLVMDQRAQVGFTWVPSALQPSIKIAPGLNAPGVAPYDPLHPPAGSIAVTINAADLKPFDPPITPAAPSTITKLVGPLSIANLYLPVVGDDSPDGTEYTDDRGTFIKHKTVGPFGNRVYWEKIR